MSTVGENLKNLRKQSKLSQFEFALKMKTTQQRVSEWETNKVEPSLYNVKRILDIYGITFEELVDGVEFE